MLMTPNLSTAQTSSWDADHISDSLLGFSDENVRDLTHIITMNSTVHPEYPFIFM